MDIPCRWVGNSIALVTNYYLPLIGCCPTFPCKCDGAATFVAFHSFCSSPSSSFSAKPTSIGFFGNVSIKVCWRCQRDPRRPRLHWIHVPAAALLTHTLRGLKLHFLNNQSPINPTALCLFFAGGIVKTQHSLPLCRNSPCNFIVLFRFGKPEIHNEIRFQNRSYFPQARPETYNL